jgi:hypothetical protein
MEAGKRFGPLSLNLTPVCVVMKKLVVALISVLAVAFVAGGGFAAEKPATAAPVKADTQVKPADAGKARQNKQDAAKQPGASKKTDSGKQPDASKKTDAAGSATGAQAGAITQDNPVTTRASRRQHAAAAHTVKSKSKKYVHAKRHVKRHAKHHARAVHRRHRHRHLVRHHGYKHAAAHRVKKHVKKHARGAAQVHKSGKASKSAVEPKKVVKPAEPKKEVKPAGPKKEVKPVEPKKENSAAGAKKDNKPAEPKKHTK